MHAQTQERRKSRWGRRIGFAGAGLVVLALVLVGLAPTLLSTGTGIGFIVSTINGSIPGTVAIDDLSLSWASGQWAKGVSVRDTDGLSVLDVERIDAPGLSLTSALTGGMALGEVTVGPTRANIVRFADGQTNLERALGLGGPSTPSTEPTKLPRDLSAKVVLEGADLTYTSADLAPVAVRVHGATLDMPSLAQATVMVMADAAAGEGASQRLIAAAQGERMLEANVTVTSLADAAGLLTLDKMDVDAVVELRELPVGMAAALMGMSDVLEALLGPTARGTVRAKGKLDALDGSIALTTAHAAADIALVPGADALRIREGSKARLELTPEGWSKIAQDDSRLLAPATVEVTFDELMVPRTESGVNLAGAKLGASATVSELTIDTGDERVGRIGLRETRARVVTSESLGQGLSANLTTRPYQGSDSGELTATAKVDRVVDARGNVRDFSLGGWSVTADVSALPTAVIDRLAPTMGLAGAALGERLEAKLAVEAAEVGQGAQGAGTFTVRASAPRLEMNLAGRVAGDQVALHGGSSVVQWRVPTELLPMVWQALGEPAAAVKDVTLAAPATVNVRFTELSAPLSAFDPAKVRLGLEGTVDQLALRSSMWPEGAVLREVKLNLPAGSLAGVIEAAGSAQLAYQGAVSPVELAGGYQAFGEATGVKHLQLSARELPTALVDQLAKQDGLLTTVVGQRVEDVRISLNPGAGDVMDFDVNLRAPQLTAAMKGQYEPGKLVALAEGAQARLLLTPESYAAIQKRRAGDAAAAPGAPGAAPALSLAAPAWVEMTAGGTRLAMAQTPAAAAKEGEEPGALDAINLRQSRINLGLKADQMTFMRAGDPKPIRLANIQATVVGENPAEKIEANLSADLANDVTAQAQPGAVRMAATAHRPADAAGKLVLGARQVSATAKMDQTPSILIDQLLNYEGKLAAAVGPVVTLGADYAGTEGGKLDVSLTGDNVQWALAGQVDEDWNLTLREDSTGQFAVTREFSQEYIRPVNPLVRALSVESAQSQKPVTATLRKDQFAAKLYPFDIGKARADIDLDLGTLALESGSAVFQVLSLIGTAVPDVGRYATAEQPFEFSPVTLQVKDGVLSYPSMTMARGDFVMVFGGQVNLVNKNIGLSMGLPGSTINKISRDTAGYIAPTDAIRVPFSGTISEPRFDRQQLTREMAALGARIGVRKLVPGEAGEAVGQILDILGGRRRAEPEKKEEPK